MSRNAGQTRAKAAPSRITRIGWNIAGLGLIAGATTAVSMKTARQDAGGARVAAQGRKGRG